MFNPDLKKMLKSVNSRYSLVLGTAKRAREIQEEANSNEQQLDTKTVSMAIDEIQNGKYIIEEPRELRTRTK